MNDEIGLAWAIALAKQADPKDTWKNPRVGAVIVDHNGQVLGQGYHHRYGDRHAEVDALAQVEPGTDLKSATLYVSLEPCCQQGKVGPCTTALIEAGIGRVVIGSLDPNPAVNGRGVAILQATGVEVDVQGADDNRQALLNPAFVYYHKTGKPYVQLKLAESGDWQVAAQQGQQTKITNQVVDQAIHALRGRQSAILIGSETALVDQPALTVRSVKIDRDQPLRIILDRRGSLQKQVAAGQWATRTLIYSQNKDFVRDFDQVQEWSGDLQELLVDLGQRGCQSLLVEGGPTIIKAFLKAQAWQSFDLYQTASRFGSVGVQGLSPATIAAAGGQLKATKVVGHAIDFHFEREVH